MIGSNILTTMLSEYLAGQIDMLSAQQGGPKHRLLYEALRRAVLGGKLLAGYRIPPSRNLALDLQISRNTVVAALNRLSSEGLLTSHVGRGTYVNGGLMKKPARRQQRQAIRLSGRGQRILNTFSAAELEIYPFTSGIVDFSAFPLGVWRRLQHKHWRMAYPDMLDYSYSGGHAPLRNAVVGYLRVFRNLAVDVEQVFITSGTQQSIELCAQILADYNDTVWLEDPAYWGAAKAFVAAGLHLHPVPVDGLGMAPIVSKTVPAPRLIYVTPSHQYPTGVVMPISRRQEILTVARKYEAWVLEDDYDSEFRFSGPVVEAIASLDTDQRVIYMGSFSKVLYPGLKLGYIVVPKGLAAPMMQAHYDLNRPGQIPLQAALAEFIEMGHFTAALRSSRQSYAQRRRSLLDALKPCLGTLAHISGAEQGLHLCVNLPSGIDDKALAQRIGSTGLSVRALSAYCVTRKDLRGLVIGYGYAPLAEIQRHGPALARSIKAALSSYRRDI